jgi:hypothetical protein
VDRDPDEQVVGEPLAALDRAEGTRPRTARAGT